MMKRGCHRCQYGHYSENENLWFCIKDYKYHNKMCDEFRLSYNDYIDILRFLELCGFEEEIKRGFEVIK